jgi:hypothetical protein
MSTEAPDLTDDIGDEVRWLYHHGAAYDEILEHYAGRIDNDQLAQFLLGVHVIDPFRVQKSVRALLALRAAHDIPRQGRTTGQ